MRTRLLLALVIVPVILLAAACTRDSGDSARRGDADELRVFFATPRLADPQRTTIASDQAVLRQLFRGLLWYDEKLNLVPMAAKELPTVKNGGISADGLVYRFNLRDGLKWSDGAPLTAFDFEYALKRLLDPSTQSPLATAAFDIRGAEDYNGCRDCSASELERVRAEVGVKAINDNTLALTVRFPRATALYSLVQLYPLRKDIIEMYGDLWTEPAFIVGNGPFLVREWTRGGRLVMEANPNWWGKQPRVKRLVFPTIAGAGGLAFAYDGGGLDLLSPPPLALPVLNHPKLEGKGVQLPSLYSYALFFNQRVPPFDDQKVRQAFSLALDREAFVKEVQWGSARVSYSWIPPGVAGHDDKLGRQWTFNPERARKLLAEAGFPDGRGLPRITYHHGYLGIAAASAAYVQEQLRRHLNVSIDVKPLNDSESQELLTNRKYQLIFSSVLAGYADGEALLREVWTCQRYEGGNCTRYSGRNFSQYANPEFDRLIQQASKESDRERRGKLYGKAEKLLIDDTPAVFMSSGIRSVFVKSYVKGLVHTPLDVLPGEYFLDRVYIAKK